MDTSLYGRPRHVVTCSTAHKAQGSGRSHVHRIARERPYPPVCYRDSHLWYSAPDAATTPVAAPLGPIVFAILWMAVWVALLSRIRLRTELGTRRIRAPPSDFVSSTVFLSVFSRMRPFALWARHSSKGSSPAGTIAARQARFGLDPGVLR